MITSFQSESSWQYDDPRKNENNTGRQRLTSVQYMLRWYDLYGTFQYDFTILCKLCSTPLQIWYTKSSEYEFVYFYIVPIVVYNEIEYSSTLHDNKFCSWGMIVDLRNFVFSRLLAVIALRLCTETRFTILRVTFYSWLLHLSIYFVKFHHCIIFMGMMMNLNFVYYMSKVVLMPFG